MLLYLARKKVDLKLSAIPPKTSPKHGSISPPFVSYGGVLRTTILEVMENKYWLLEPRDSFLDVNQDDIDEMRELAGLEPDAMTLAKAKREEELLEECADEV